MDPFARPDGPEHNECGEGDREEDIEDEQREGTEEREHEEEEDDDDEIDLSAVSAFLFQSGKAKTYIRLNDTTDQELKVITVNPSNADDRNTACCPTTKPEDIGDVDDYTWILDNTKVTEQDIEDGEDNEESPISAHNARQYGNNPSLNKSLFDRSRLLKCISKTLPDKHTNSEPPT